MRIKIFDKKDILIIIACFIGIGVCYGLQYSFGIFFVKIGKFFNLNNSQTSFIFSLTLLTYGLYNPIVGFLVSKYGGRKIFKIASFILFLGFFLSSFATKVWHLYIFLGVLTSIGMNSVGFIPISIIISNNFVLNRGAALGIATTGVGAGAFVFSQLSNFLLTLFSWKQVFIFIGVFTGLLIFFISFFLPRLDTPRYIKPQKESLFKLKEIFIKKEFWLIQFGMTFGAMTTQGLMLHIVPYLLNKGATQTITAIVISIIGIVGSIGKIFWGILSDNFKPYFLFYFAALLIIFALSLLLLSPVPIPIFFILLFSIFFGLGYGSFAPLFPALTYEKFSGKNFGNILGFASMGNGIGACFSTWFLGFIFDKTNNYNYSVACLIIFIVLSTVSFYCVFKLKLK